MVGDGPLGAADDEDQVGDARRRRFLAAYWISGLSTMGSISLGLALVAGRKRVPMPAAGKMAFVTLFIFKYPRRPFQ
jgi:hypothetical protein